MELRQTLRGIVARIRELMSPSQRPHSRWPLVVVGMLTGLLAVTSCTSCTGTRPTTLGPPERVNTKGVPLIRVKLGQAVRGVQLTTSGEYRLLADGKVLDSGRQFSAILKYTGGAWEIHHNSQDASLGRGRAVAPGKNLTLSVNGDNGLIRYALCDASGNKPAAAAVQYRGDFLLLPQTNDTFLVVNQVDMESYVAGVVPKELYASWHHETYRALGVAARTFAFYHRQQSVAQNRPYDVGDGESSQVYGGYTAERSVAHARQAVESTRGKVLTWNGQVIMSQYSSCCGGRVNPARVLRSDAPADGPFAGGQECNDCRASARFSWAPVTVNKGQLLAAIRARYAAANSLGSITDIRVKTQTPWGRAILIDVIGPGGSVTIRMDDLRLAWNSYNGGPSKPGFLWSANCQWQMSGDNVIFHNGRGFGHGVGLCQFGAEGKAQRGWRGEQILGAYYPGAKLTTMWK